MRKPCAGSTAPSFGTRSRTWPYEARTVKSLPRYLLIVLALAGDSTMRRFLAMGGGAFLAVRGAEWEPRQYIWFAEEHARGRGHGRSGLHPFIVESRRGVGCQALPRDPAGQWLPAADAASPM